MEAYVSKYKVTFNRPEAGRSNRGQIAITSRIEPVAVAIVWDDPRLEVIGLSSSEIAGSPRNIY